uniref:non-specific serine/threonine protein kinase n=1 Tax=Albugo laibachii Nc14 TaxID=890382 RepID=F0WBR8_9STRA|nr:NimArelated protein kinase 6 putative [Albugo laibachii Nc14]CCA20552.1 NimArelated protein kinase 6 putative [Albugo laibachii Nc14]|eukprot:CCA20552.1 NimArelated protein kinase 6 putative [Albugo laibachii Nc14]
MELLTAQQRLLFEHGGQLSDYRLIRRIGKGKFSIVYKAERIADARTIALKKIAIFDVMNAVAREKTLKEVRLVQSVQHRNIIAYADAFIEERELYIAFEWAAAGDLKRQIRKANEKGVRFGEASIWKYFTQLCSAVRYLHRERRIMHRDLKPANIFLTYKGEIKLGDLGLGRHFSDDTYQAHSKVGTPLYMSPEVLRGEPYDWSSDIWSLGCILYELIMLRNPFKSEGLNLHGLFMKINKGEYESLSLMYSEKLRSLVSRMLSLDAASRISIDDVWQCCQYASSTPDRISVKSIRKPYDVPAIKVQASSVASKSDSDQHSASLKENAQLADEETTIRQYKTAILMEAVMDKLGLLGYKTQNGYSIPPDYFTPETNYGNRRSDARFNEMCHCSLWLLTKIGVKFDFEDTGLLRKPRVRAVQTLLVLAEKANASVREVDLHTLVAGSGYSVCLFLNSLCDEAVRSHVFHRPIYKHDRSGDLDLVEQSDAVCADPDSDEATLSSPEFNGDCADLAEVNARADNRRDNLDDRDYIFPKVAKDVWEDEVERVSHKLEALRSRLKATQNVYDCSWRVHLVIHRRYGDVDTKLRLPTLQTLTSLTQAWIVVVLSTYMMK